MINDMFKGTYGLQKALDASWQNNKAIIGNIANADTPGYKKQNTDFGTALAKAVGKGNLDGATPNPNHIPISGQSAGNSSSSAATGSYTDTSSSMRLDGNNVDIEDEMAKLAKNNILYSALTQKIAGEFSKLRQAISGGGN